MDTDKSTKSSRGGKVHAGSADSNAATSASFAAATRTLAPTSPPPPSPPPVTPPPSPPPSSASSMNADEDSENSAKSTDSRPDDATSEGINSDSRTILNEAKDKWLASTSGESWGANGWSVDYLRKVARAASLTVTVQENKKPKDVTPSKGSRSSLIKAVRSMLVERFGKKRRVKSSPPAKKRQVEPLPPASPPSPSPSGIPPTTKAQISSFGNGGTDGDNDIAAVDEGVTSSSSSSPPAATATGITTTTTTSTRISSSSSSSTSLASSSSSSSSSSSPPPPLCPAIDGIYRVRCAP